jgi:hypothetical protein
MRLGEFEKRFRVSCGKTQYEVAEELGYKWSCATDISRLETDHRIRLMNGVRFRWIQFYIGSGRRQLKAKELLVFCTDLRPHEIQYLNFMSNI